MQTQQPQSEAVAESLDVPVTVAVPAAEVSPADNLPIHVDIRGKEGYGSAGRGFMAPKRVICAAESNDIVRLNLPYTYSRCGGGAGLDAQDIVTLPIELKETGLSELVWAEHAARCPTRSSHVDVARSCVTWPFTFFLGCLFCGLTKQRVLAFDDALRRWQSEFNTVLAPFGMHVKTQAFKFGSQAGCVVERWCAISLNMTETEKLKSEPYVMKGHGVQELRQYPCGGFDENELCMLPPDGHDEQSCYINLLV